MSRNKTKNQKILFPGMLDIHFRMLVKVLKSYGYDAEMLTDSGDAVIEEGLKYVHNDACYPAIVTIGQFIAALKSGRYDLSNTSLFMSQTGGGCRASNYIHLLRKALKRAGMSNVPVYSVNLAGLESNQSGLKLTLPLIRKAVAAFTYGDLLMLLERQTKPYEAVSGETEEMVELFIDDLCEQFERRKGYSRKAVLMNCNRMVHAFEGIKRVERSLIKVGIVGEIYVKYSPLANNKLVQFLESQGCEVMVPGLMSFLYYCMGNCLEDARLYGGGLFKTILAKLGFFYLQAYERHTLSALKGSRFTAPASYEELKRFADPVIPRGCKMGEGWLLTAEAAELIAHGYDNVICVQPFGCLPNHIVGKGMIRKLSGIYPDASIVPIDYDASATRVNQENRIKLMLAIARERMKKNEEVSPSSQIEPIDA